MNVADLGGLHDFATATVGNALQWQLLNVVKLCVGVRFKYTTWLTRSAYTRGASCHRRHHHSRDPMHCGLTDRWLALNIMYAALTLDYLIRKRRTPEVSPE